MIRKSTAFLVCVTFLLSAVLGVHIIASVSGIEGITEPVYLEIADYYDNRRAVVTVTADDWIYSTWQQFEDMSKMLTEKRIYYTGAIITNFANWTQIQQWLNQGYAEAASHSLTHPSTVPYSDYDSEIGGSKQDIIANLALPSNFSYSSTEYVYTWIQPYNKSDSAVRQKLGEYKYLTDRDVSTDDGWATWDSTNGLFDGIGFSMRMESPIKGGVDNATILNNKFDSVYAAGQIYHLMTHPRNVNWELGQYADLHTSYISNRKDIWYVNFGLLYVYHWIDTQNIVQVTSTGSLQDKVFKITISSTDRQNYGAKYPVTYVFDIPPSWTNGYVNYSFQETDPWTTMETKTSSDFFNGINAVRFDFSNHKAYVSIGFDDASNEIYLQILPQDSEPTANFTASPTSGPEPLTVSFTDTSTSYDGIILWNWSFGDGAFEENVSPTHTYAQDGDYLVTLTVTDADGSTDSISQTITVSDRAPVADFNALPTSGTEPLLVNFEDTSTSYDGIIGWTWDFGDGHSSTDQTPTHIYAADDTYTAILTVVEGDGDSAVKIKEAYIMVTDTSPSANFTASQTSEALTVSFAYTSTSYDEIVSWAWNFGDGQTSTEQNPTHKFPDDGVFNVSLTVTDIDGSTDTISKSITIYDVVPPVTVDDYDGLWHTSDFTINLTATDDLSGVQTVYYIINDGPVMDVRTHGQPRISVEGHNKLEYWGVDFYGNEETHHVIQDIKLDKTSRARAMWIVGGIVLAIATSAAGTILWRNLNKTPTLRKEKEEN